MKKSKKKLKALKTHLIKEEVDEHDIALVLSRWTGIPVEKLQTTETEKLLHMAEILKKRVIGQDEAIEEITHAIQMHRTGLTDPNKPIGSFLIFRPTVLAKLKLQKHLQIFYLMIQKDSYELICLNTWKNIAVARLIGAPPGYVGYEEGGQLTEASAPKSI